MLVALFSLAAVVYAQTISFGSAHLDLNGCAGPSGTYTCYQQAQNDQLVAEKACNSTNSNGGNGPCLVGASAQYYIQTIGCMTQGCWNKDCDYQIVLAAYVNDIIHTDSFPAFPPPFYNDDYNSLPGSCVCNIPSMQQLTLISFFNECPQSDIIFNSCLCCAEGQRLAELQYLCPNNSLDAVNGRAYLQQWASDPQSCAGYQQSNWHDLYTSQCSTYGVTPADGTAGFLNPLSLPTGFPATATLSNIGGSVTALSQLNITGSTSVFPWASGSTTTFTFSTSGASAAAGTPASNSRAASTGGSMGSTARSQTATAHSAGSGTATTSAGSASTSQASVSAATRSAMQISTLGMVISLIASTLAFA